MDVIVRAVERRKKLDKETALLIGEPDTYSYERIQNELGRLIHDVRSWETFTVPKTMARAGTWVEQKIPGIEDPFIKPWMVEVADDHYVLDIAKARSLLDWEPRHRLIETLPSMIKALKSDPEGWYRRHKIHMPGKVKEEVRAGE